MRIARIMGLIAVLCLGSSVFADTLYNINLYRVITEYSGPAVLGEEGDYWNFVPANLGMSSTEEWALNDADGNSSSLVLDSSAVTANGYSSSTDQTNSVLRDFWSPANDVQTLVFSGLDDSKTYDFYIFSDKTSSNYKPTITIGTESQTAVSTTWYTTYVLGTNYVVFEDVSPTDGSISIAFVCGTEGVNAPVNGMQIVEVPEPATMLLLGSGGLVALIRKNRR